MRQSHRVSKITSCPRYAGTAYGRITNTFLIGSKLSSGKYIAFQICICYNAGRQKEIASPSGQRTNPQTVLQHSLGILLFFYTGKAPSRLFVVLIVTVKPFADEVANHTCQNSNYKGNYDFHLDTSSLLPGIGETRQKL